MKNLFKLLMLTVVCAWMTGCKPQPGTVDSNGMPKSLQIAVVQSENIDEIKKVRLEIADYLSKKLGMPVTFIEANDYTAVIEAIKSHKVHMADIPPFAYVVATRTMKLVPLVTLGQNGKPSSYNSVLIVNGHGNIKSMDDVKANHKKYVLGFADAASTSGHLIPRAYLTSIGLNPDTAFKQTIFAGSHPANVLSVKAGKIDVGCTTDLIFKIMKSKGMIGDDDIRVIWKSDPIVAEPIVVREDINKDFAKKIQQAYLDINKERPEILKKYLHIFLNDTAKRSYMVANDTMYNGLRKIAAGIKDLKAN